MPKPTQGSVYPGLTYNDPEAAIAWLCKTFGLTKRLVVPREGGGILHSELSMGAAVFMVGSPRAEAGRKSPVDLGGVNQVLSVWVEDPDAHYAHSIKEGAELVEDLETAAFGARGYTVKDLEGHLWHFSDYVPGAFWEEGN